MEQRSLERFRKRTIWTHWLHLVTFAILLITGALMFFRLTDFTSGYQIRTVHRISGVFFVVLPVFFAIVDPRTGTYFLREAFAWSRDDLIWLKSALKYYFGSRVLMPPQGRINGDQKLWQAVVTITGLVFILTGTLLWFFKFKIPIAVYEGFLLTHVSAFIVVSVSFLVHFYLRTLHPTFDESLSSMLDGKVSQSYAREHYIKWYEQKSSADEK